jgi:hypothetical protein
LASPIPAPLRKYFLEQGQNQAKTLDPKSKAQGFESFNTSDLTLASTIPAPLRKYFLEQGQNQSKDLRPKFKTSKIRKLQYHATLLWRCLLPHRCASTFNSKVKTRQSP